LTIRLGRQGTGAGRAVGTGPPGLPVDGIEAVPEEADGDGDEDRLVWGKCRQVADPGAAGTQAEQDKRQNAAGRSPDGPEDAAGGDPAGTLLIDVGLIHILRCVQHCFLGSNLHCTLFKPILPVLRWAL
jgi:hypothetical protein